MFKVLGIATICAFCATPALAKKGAETAQRTVAPMRDNFDLATIPAPGTVAPEDACPEDPVLPRNMSQRAFDPPAMKMELIDDGPILSLGAMGARFKDAPRLAHVAIGMDF